MHGFITEVLVLEETDKEKMYFVWLYRGVTVK